MSVMNPEKNKSNVVSGFNCGVYQSQNEIDYLRDMSDFKSNLFGFSNLQLARYQMEY